MARPLRIEFPGAIYHVVNRGVERRVLFSDPEDHLEFLKSTVAHSTRIGAELHAYCLMPNHYHLIIGTPEGRLRDLMRGINGDHARRYNRKYIRVGHLFQGRYTAVLLQDDEHLVQAVRYVHENPVKAGLEEEPTAFRWSSAKCYARLRSHEVPIRFDLVLGILSRNMQEAARILLNPDSAEKAALHDPVKDAIAGVLSGTEAYRNLMARDHLPRGRDERVSRLGEAQHPSGAALTSIAMRVTSLRVGRRLARPMLLWALHRGTSMTHAEIALATKSKSAMAVGQAVHRLERLAKADANVAAHLASLRRLLRGGAVNFDTDPKMSNVKT